MQARTIDNYFKARKQPLTLWRGKGYWYFIYDDGGAKYETKSIMVCYLNQLSFQQWIDEGQVFLATIAEEED